MKNAKQVMLMATIIALLLGCQGKQGDPGPTGATGPAGTDLTSTSVNGSFSGTITGTRKDGMALNENFSFTYAPNTEGFSATVGGIQSLNLYRYGTLFGAGSYLNFNLLVSNKGATNQTITLDPTINRNAFSFTKTLTSNQALVVKMDQGLILKDYYVLHPVDPANTVYPFSFTYYFGDNSYAYVYNSYLNINGNTAYGFPTKNGEVVYYYPNYVNGTYGSFAQIVSADGTVSKTSATYGSLKLDYYSSTDYSGYIFRDANGNNLSKTAAVPADTYTITNFTYDKTSGNLSFDFTLNYGGYPKPNSTGNPLTVTGKFTGKVFDSIVNSIGNANNVSDQ
jgi:hypothetical protein